MMALLNDHQDALVSDIMDEALLIASTKTAGKRVPREQKHITSTDGEVVAIHDYYFKRWMPLVGPEAVEFGQKASTKTGYNTMCKQGTSLWTKQNSTAKQATLALIDQVAEGDLGPADLPAARDAIEEARNAIEPTELGFDSKEDVIDYLQGLDIEVKQADDIDVVE